MFFRSPEDCPKRAKEILSLMVEQDEYIITDGLSVWCGSKRTNWRVVNQLLELCFISPDSASPEIYWANSSAERFLRGEAPYHCERGHEHQTIFEVLKCREGNR